MFPLRPGLGMAAPACGIQALLFSILMLSPSKRQIDLIFLWHKQAGSKLLLMTRLGVSSCTRVTY